MNDGAFLIPSVSGSCFQCQRTFENKSITRLVLLTNRWQETVCISVNSFVLVLAKQKNPVCFAKRILLNIATKLTEQRLYNRESWKRNCQKGGLTRLHYNYWLHVRLKPFWEVNLPIIFNSIVLYLRWGEKNLIMFQSPKLNCWSRLRTHKIGHLITNCNNLIWALKADIWYDLFVFWRWKLRTFLII